MINAPSDWQHRPILALVDHLAERHHDVQDAALAHLRELLWLATRQAGRQDRALAAIGSLLRELEATWEAHLDTTAVLFAHAMSLELAPGTATLPAPTAARLIQRLRVEHDSVRALFEAMRRGTSGYLSAPGAPDAVRDLYAAVSTVEREARAHAHLENDAFVARILALDPSIERDATPITLPIRQREVLSGAGRRRVLSVFCPAEKRSRPPGWCRRCPLVRQTTDETVRCTPPLESAPRVTAAVRLGEHVSVGEAMGWHPVSVGRDVVAGAVARALGESRTAVAVVVDEADHLVGTVERDRAECAREDQTANELEREGPCIRESASLADAIECMVKAHARFLPVIGAEGRVVGLLADVEALDGITASRQRR